MINRVNQSVLICFCICLSIVSCTTKQAPSSRWCDQPLRSELAQLKEIPSADPWFKVYEVDTGVYAIMEPYNFQETISYLITGSHHNVLFDTGMGMGPLNKVVAALSDKPVVVINSHSHFDHVGNNYQFDTVYAIDTAYTHAHAELGRPHEDVNDEATPAAICLRYLPDFDTAAYHILPYADRIRRYLHEGDTLNLGGRTLEVWQVPGHAPDGITLLDRKNGLLWTGDQYYDAPIWLFAEGTDLKAYEKVVRRYAAIAPSLRSVMPAHNRPAVEPQRLLDLADNFSSILQGKVKGTPAPFSAHTDPALEFVFPHTRFLIRKDQLPAGTP
ncbi:MAG: MBL fold metallo-hydrolase [Cyclobacteriaceae bacterium]|nr:MBL fold metallo-hydrolase [Cyclobacteriaceae bacterium]